MNINFRVIRTMYYQKHKAQTRGDDSYGNKFEPLDIAIYLYRYSILLIDIVLVFIRYVEYVELFTSFSFVILIYRYQRSLGRISI